jgi:predicted ATPase
LSSGEKQLIRILLDTLLAKDSSIIIDEPELSMHIDWQRVLLASMRELNPTAQIIVATHSPEIMADVPDQHIFEI